jgi:hypothetical protein
MKQELDILGVAIRDRRVPLAAAFEERFRAIEPRIGVAAPRLDLLVQVLGKAWDIERLVALAAQVPSTGYGGARISLSAVAFQERAVKAFDWALRDVLLDAYPPPQRGAFAEATTMFLALLRRAEPLAAKVA